MGVEVQQHQAQLDRGDPVGHGVVELGVHRHLVVGEPVDEVHLPERPRTVQVPRMQLADHLQQACPVPGRGQADPAQVAADVEAASVDPDRQPQPERHRHQHLPAARDQGQARRNRVE